MVNFYNQQNRDNHMESAAVAKQPAQNKAAKAIKPNFNKYTDPTDEFGSKEFKWAIWYVKNKILLYRLLIGFLIAFNIITVGFSLWRTAGYLIYDLTVKPQQDLQLSRATDYAAVQPRFNPAALQILNTAVLPGGTNKVDAYAELSNPNDRYRASVTYYFDFNGQATGKRTAVLLPQTFQPITALGLDSAVYQGGPSLVIENITWQRIPVHTVADTALWQAERLNFTTENFVYAYAGGPNSPSANAITFTLKNNSAFGYKNPLFYLGLYQGGSLVGIMQFDLVDFASQETRTVDLRNFVPNLSVDEIKVYPVIDLYDKTVYLPPKK